VVLGISVEAVSLSNPFDVVQPVPDLDQAVAVRRRTQPIRTGDGLERVLGLVALRMREAALFFLADGVGPEHVPAAHDDDISHT
jgi:hypothetical protein